MDREQDLPTGARLGRSAPVMVGDEVELVIDGLGADADGIGKLAGYVIFVPFALPGERVRVNIRAANRKFGRGELVEVVEPSKDRVQPECEHFGVCGGCQLQHLAYAAQLRRKTEQVESQVRHALGIAAPRVEPMRGPDDPWGQRTKIALHLRRMSGRLEAGLFARRSRDLVPIRECPATDSQGLAAALAAVDVLDRSDLPAWLPWTDAGVLRSIVVRQSREAGAQTTLVMRRDVPDRARIAEQVRARGAHSVVLNLNDGPAERLLGRGSEVVLGDARLPITIAGVRYLASPGAFFQTSAWGAAFLVDAVRRLVAPPREARIVDLYCGGGLLGLALAGQVAHVLGLEDNPLAVSDAAASAAANGFTNTRFVRGPVERTLRDATRGERPFAVLLDPPREGCDPHVVRAVADLLPRRVLYVSCAPEALGRDLLAFRREGYAATRIEPFDMFPHTAHVETVVLLERTEYEAKRRLLEKAPK